MSLPGTTFNLNDAVWVKVTPYGWDVFTEHYQKLGLDSDIYRNILARGEPSDWQKFQLWDLMAIFGEKMHNGFPTPLETEIRLIDPMKGLNHV